MKKEFLIIDDDPITIMLQEILLEDFPAYQNIKTFSDGLYALEYLQKTYSCDTEYIISLDINMPQLNGWEFLEAIEPLALVKKTHVFIVSSSSDKSDIEKSEKIALVKGFFVKPLVIQNLQKVEDIVGKNLSLS